MRVAWQVLAEEQSAAEEAPTSAPLPTPSRALQRLLWCHAHHTLPFPDQASHMVADMLAPRVHNLSCEEARSQLHFLIMHFFFKFMYFSVFICMRPCIMCSQRCTAQQLKVIHCCFAGFCSVLVNRESRAATHRTGCQPEHIGHSAPRPTECRGRSTHSGKHGGTLFPRHLARGLPVHCSTEPAAPRARSKARISCDYT